MDIALIVAKILGVYFVVSGLFLLLRGKTLPNMIKDLFDHPAIVYLTGAILIFLSVLFLLQENVWDGTSRTVITVIAWLTLIKGVLYILAPEMLEKMVSKKMLKMINVYGLIAILAGGYLYFFFG